MSIGKHTPEVSGVAMSGALSAQGRGAAFVEHHRHHTSAGFALLATDVVMISLALLAGASASAPKLRIWDFSAVIFSIGIGALLGVYRGGANAPLGRQFAALLASTALGFSAAELCADFYRDGGTLQFLISWAVALTLLSLSRLFRNAAVKPTGQLPSWVILGRRNEAHDLYRALTEANAIPVAGVFSDGGPEWITTDDHKVVLLGAGWAKAFAECCGIDRAVVALPEKCDADTAELVKNSANIFKTVLVAPRIESDRLRLELADRADTDCWALSTGSVAAPLHDEDAGRRIKRAFDLGAAALASLLLLPLWLLIMLAIRLTSRGPAIYQQVRIGKGNKIFKVLKFRTMYTDAAERLEHHLERDPALRAEWERVHKLKDDPRVTFVGRWLRRFSMDELPQLWNIIRGDMSLVGPRPIVIHEIAKYGSAYAAYECVKPGLTGLWQISGRNDTTYQQRVDYDVQYVENWSLKLDAQILARTFRAVISGVGAY